MRILILSILTFVLFVSCSKSVPKTTATVPPTDTPVTPPSLSNPVPLDTINDWIRIGRVANNLEDIWFTSNTVGFIVSNSNIFKTIDNGITWQIIPNTNYSDLYNLQFIDDQNGFVQGGRELGITHDGGTTWVFKSLPYGSGLYFQFLSITTGFYGDEMQGIQKTSDGGDHWTSISGSTQKTCPFYFMDSLTGFSMNNGDFSKTINGGLNWVLKTSQVATFNTGYFKMQFVDSSTGFCGTTGGLLKTTDGGLTWVNKLVASTIFIVPYFFDASNGYCIVRSTIYKTTDGGLNWKVSCQLSGDSFSGFHFLDMNTGWASSFGGYVFRLK